MFQVTLGETVSHIKGKLLQSYSRFMKTFSKGLLYLKKRGGGSLLQFMGKLQPDVCLPLRCVFGWNGV